MAGFWFALRDLAREQLAEVDQAVAEILGTTDPLDPIDRDEASGWVPVDASTLETRHAGVFAIGDATAIRLMNGMYLPKARVFADEQARSVATRIVAEASGAETAPQYSGRGACYIEVGGGLAAYGSGNFYAMPAPSVALEAPSQRFRQEKADMERGLLAPWE